MMQGEVSRAVLEDRLASGAPTQETMAEAPVLVVVAGANMIPHVDDGHVNEVEPRPRDATNRAALIPGSLRGPNFSPPCENASNDVGSSLGSFDIVDLGAGEPGMSGYPRESL
jgi:hypothetical protein